MKTLAQNESGPVQSEKAVQSFFRRSDQWCKRHRARIRVNGDYFEHTM